MVVPRLDRVPEFSVVCHGSARGLHPGMEGLGIICLDGSFHEVKLLIVVTAII